MFDITIRETSEDIATGIISTISVPIGCYHATDLTRASGAWLCP